MEAFGTLVTEMDSAELKSVYAAMCDKGLRVHVDMLEFVENWRRDLVVKKKKERERGKEEEEKGGKVGKGGRSRR